MATSTIRRRSSGLNPLLVVLLLLLAVCGTAATLHATGKVKIAFLDQLFGDEVQAADRSGQVAIPLSARPLRPGQRVDRTDVWDPVKNLPAVIWVDADSVNEAWKRTPLEIEGRVMARAKMPGKTFTEGDFLPPGSQEGAVGLVPDGMRLIGLDPADVMLLDRLQYQDRFDLVVSEKVDDQLLNEAEQALDRQGAASMQRKLQLANLKEMAHQRVLVQDGMIIQPASDDPKAGKKDKLVQVAIWPEQVLPLLEALDLDRTVYCVARSGNAAVKEERAIPAQETPLEKLAWIYDSVQEIEVYSGNQRTAVAVPKVE